ncbi:MAG TPA: hypothetical protein DEP01_05415 [Aminobacterium sp.]|uniref:hypothetical protein n=1 Tax=Aminobacterium TaxID=81466 RepID=UPI0004662399|nr:MULTISPECIES: hypothetical protein [Aminobacterium]HCA40970.1 hypothetical protein [Aminobacterium sp.]
MALGRSGNVRWWMLIICIIIGTLLGFYLQKFTLTAPYFRNIISIGFDLHDVRLAIMDFGLKFYLHCNVGTLIGGIVGLWIAR